MSTISVRIDDKRFQEFKAVCDLLHINASDFLRSCCQEFTMAPEEFLEKLGFKKVPVWVKPEFGTCTQCDKTNAVLMFGRCGECYLKL
jgi:hypothetical protein